MQSKKITRMYLSHSEALACLEGIRVLLPDILGLDSCSNRYEVVTDSGGPPSSKLRMQFFCPHGFASRLREDGNLKPFLLGCVAVSNPEDQAGYLTELSISWSCDSLEPQELRLQVDYEWKSLSRKLQGYCAKVSKSYVGLDFSIHSRPAV